VNRLATDVDPRTLSTPAPHASAAIAIASLGTFLALATFCGPLTNMPTLAAALDAGPEARTWLLSSMSVGVAAALLTSGSLADNLGRRRVFVWGSLALAVGALVSGVATGPELFIAGRVLSGVGSAAILASSLGIIAHVSPTPAARAKASGVWGAALGAGGAVGPLVAGGLDEVHQWRALYVAMFLLGLLVAVAGRSRVVESLAETPRPIDLSGAATLTAAVVLTLIALTEGRDGVTPAVLGAGTLSLMLLAAFVVIELRRSGPMVDLRLFRSRGFSAATVGALGVGLGVVGLLSFACTFFIAGLGMSSLHAAVLLLAWSGTGTVAALLARRLPAGLGGARQMVIALLLTAVGEVAMLGQVDADGGGLLPGLFVVGVGYGVLNAALGQQSIATVPAAQAAMGSGANNTARYIGSAIGVTLVIIAARGADTGLEAAWDHAVGMSAGLTALAAVVVAILSAGGRREAVPVRAPAA
jgi:MFS family permease